MAADARPGSNRPFLVATIATGNPEPDCVAISVSDRAQRDVICADCAVLDSGIVTDHGACCRANIRGLEPPRQLLDVGGHR